MRSTARQHLPRGPLFLIAALAACTGSIARTDEATAPQPAPDSPEAPAPNGADTASGMPGGAAAPAAVSPVPLRRLTRAEYAATVRDLLGLDPPENIQFVPEERVRWFENDAEALTLSPVLAEQYLNAAESLSTRAVAQLERYVPCAPRADDGCATTLIRELGQRAYRRPLTDDEAAGLTAAYHAGKADGGFRAGVEQVLRMMLIAPQFLYRIELGEPAGIAGTTRPTSWEMASRLSYFLLGTMPDAALFEAAAANRLITPAAVAAEAQRLIESPRAKAAVAHVLRQWLDLDEIDRMEKLTTAFPEWRPALAPLMRREVDVFLENAFFGPEGTLQALYTSPRTTISRELAPLYGVPATAGPVALDPTKRAGLLTLLGTLSVHAANDDTSPTLRGAFVRARLLCGELPPPPPSVNNQRPPLSTVKTTRERVNQHAADPSCAGCHVLIDPIGFGFETFDGIGKRRETENGKPIDDSGEVVNTSIGRFKGAVELARKVGVSPEAARCLVTQIYRSALGRTEHDTDASALAGLAQVAAGTAPGSLKKAIVAVTQTDAFLYRTRPASKNGGR